MRKIREVLRLKYESKLSNSRIAISCNISRKSVRKYVARAEKAGLTWPLPMDLDDVVLEQRLFPTEYLLPNPSLPDWAMVHQELKKKGVTLWLLWEEHKAIYPNCFQYTRFCQCYREFKNKLHPTMRQTYKAGEKLFVDFAGLTLPWIDQTTGEIHQAEIFVAVLGASNYTYIEALSCQSLPAWIGAHVNALEFIGGAPAILVPDNSLCGAPHNE